jgi:hypothetical protein
LNNSSCDYNYIYCTGPFIVRSAVEITYVSFQNVWASVATGMKYMRKTAGYTWIDRKTNTEIAKELNITPVLDKIQEYRRNCLQLVNRQPHHRLQGIIKKTTDQKAEGTRGDHYRDFWMCETRTGQPVAQTPC